MENIGRCSLGLGYSYCLKLVPTNTFLARKAPSNGVRVSQKGSGMDVPSEYGVHTTLWKKNPLLLLYCFSDLFGSWQIDLIKQ